MAGTMLKQEDAREVLATTPSGKVDFIYIDPPFNTGRPNFYYPDKWPSAKDHAVWFRHIVNGVPRVMKDTASIAVHCDWRSSHHLRHELDGIFGEDNFINHVVWCYNSGGASKRHFSRKHDDILIYSKTKDYKFNVQREPYPNDYGDRPGFHPEGRIMNDWWQIPFLATNSKERCGYATQKPLALLKRLIEAFTEPGDLVMDFFCGSGTTGVAAIGLGRDAYLADTNPDAIKIATQRLEEAGSSSS